MSRDIYLVIGNTDGKLSSEEWRNFQTDIKATTESVAEKIWGIWYSDPTTKYQNMCISLLLSEENATSFKDELRQLATRFHQNSIAWSTAETELIKP